MLDIDYYLKYTITTYLIISIIIWVKKPSVMFDRDGQMKNFGIGPNKTIFYYPLILIILAIITFSVFNLRYLGKSLYK